MIEYIFFDTQLQNKFVDYAASLGVDCTLHSDLMGLVVSVSEDLNDATDEALEACYDKLQGEQAQLLAQVEGGFKQIAGFRYAMPDGQSRMAAISTDAAHRLLSVFSLSEIQELFTRVARSALSQDEKPLCKSLPTAPPV